MFTNLLLLFILLNFLNVITQTAKSIATIKCGKWGASIVNALAYGLYTIVIVYTMCELDLWVKVLVVSFSNLAGVYVVKFFEEKFTKEKLWLVKMTIPKASFEITKATLKENNIPYSYVDIEKYVVFDCYCDTSKQTGVTTAICKANNGKMFATENKFEF